MKMDDGGWSGSLSENIWLDLRPTEVRRGFWFPKETSVTDKDLYKSLRLQIQSHLVTTAYVCFLGFFVIYGYGNLLFKYCDISKYIVCYHKVQFIAKQTASSCAGCGKWKLKVSKE